MASVIRRTGSRRRTINEINMVPFIDVMLVLLIIFMVSAPLITTGLVDLPTVGKSRQRRIDGKAEGAAIPLARLKARVLEAQAGKPETPVVISADRAVKYEAVVKVMDTLQRAGVQRVGLSVKNAGA